MYQNLFPPVALISNGGNATITCATPTIVLTNQSTSGIPASTGFPTNLPVIGYAWYAPFQPGLTNSTTYTAGTSGTYTMIAKDLNNGCTSMATMELYGDCNMVGIQNNPNSGTYITIFPNPNNGLFIIKSEEFQKNASIEVYNSLGVLIKKQTVTSERTELNLSENTVGIYIVHVLQNDKVMHISKLVKE